MALIDEVNKACRRLAPKGWGRLFEKHGLDITKQDLKAELLRVLPDKSDSEPEGIDRSVLGFEDFSREGHRGVTPGDPGRSLLYHGFASPNVTHVGDVELKEFPTPKELIAIENFVFGPVFGEYGDRLRTIQDLRHLAARVSGAATNVMAIAVFALEYRPAVETVHRKHADLCLARTGIARVGTAEPSYDPRRRGYRPFVEGDKHELRVLPVRYAAFLAVQCKGERPGFGPMRPQAGDGERNFWVPLHKLFDGDECLAMAGLEVRWTAQHVNEKIRRIHMEIRRRGFNGGWGAPDIDNPPFRFTDDIADFQPGANALPGLLIPFKHQKLIAPAKYKGKALTFSVPEGLPEDDWWDFAPSLTIKSTGADRDRPAPEYVHVRRAPDEDEPDLNQFRDVAARVKQGNYRAQHYVDFTGDGWIDVSCPQLDSAFPRRVPAYSIVATPDFYFNCDERELVEWTEQSVPKALREEIWSTQPEPLCDERLAPNLKLTNVDFHSDDLSLPRADFRSEDKTVAAIVCLPDGNRQQTDLPPSRADRHCSLPDGASGTFAPGWDTSRDTTHGTAHFSAYGLGSPFPEDSKLCAALSTYWPGVAPDAGRSFSELFPSVNPLTDEENGQVGTLPWDGVPGPKQIGNAENRIYEFESFDHVDYVETALQKKFTLALTGQVSTQQYEQRVLATARAYRAASRVTTPAIPRIRGWFLLSFRAVPLGDPELTAARGNGAALVGPVFRYRFAERDPNQSGVAEPADVRRVRIRFKRMITVFAGSEAKALAKLDDFPWKRVNTN